MSLYTSVYWTKRALIVLSLIIFICSGFRIFQFIGRKFTKTTPQISDFKAELGFGPIDKITLTPLNIPPTFKPTEFKNSTLKGNFDVDNGYPLETTRSPIANVYKITEIPIDLETTENPRKIAKNFGFTKEPVAITSTSQTWSEGNKELQINGQYLLIKYKDEGLKRNPPPSESSVISPQTDFAKGLFSDILKSYGIITDLDNYKFRIDYINYDKTTNNFVAVEKNTFSQFIRINAERQYPTLFKEIDGVTTNATYPNRLYSNNYIIVPANISQSSEVKNNVVEISLHNWPLNSDTKEKASESIQTYNIKTPKQAYNELINENKYLISVSEISIQGDTRLPYNVEKLEGISRVDIFRIRLEMYEDVVNTTYIQPVYVFICQAEQDGTLLELIYYVPALIDAVTK